MTEKELFIACCGIDEEGFAKANVNVSVGLVNVSKGLENPEYKPFDNLYMQNAVVNINRTLFHTIVDLDFGDNSEELSKLVSILKGFENINRNIALSDTEYQCVAVTISPSNTNEYVINAVNGIYSLTVKDLSAKCSTISFVFDNRMINCYQEEE